MDLNKQRLIDANALSDLLDVEYKRKMELVRKGEEHLNTLAEGIMSVSILLGTMPTVDVVEVPPVKIGDTAYFIIKKNIYEAKICLITLSQYRYITTTEIRGEVQKYHSVSARFSDWGKTVFATKEEAERKLYPCEHCISGTYRSCEGCSYGERKDNA